MPDNTQGALTQVAAQSPAEGMVPGIAGGNPNLSSLLSGMLQQGQQRQSYLERQQEAYNQEMERFAQMIQQSQAPEANDSARWGAMADAASRVEPTWGNLGAMIGQVGAAYGGSRAREQQDNLKNQATLTKMRQDEVRALESRDQNAAMLRALTGSAAKVATPTIKVVDGKLVAAKWDPVEQKYVTEVLSGSQDQIKERLFRTFFDKAVSAELPNPEQYAQEQMEKLLSTFGGTTVKGESNNIPGVRSVGSPEMKIAPEVQSERDSNASRIRSGEQTGTLPEWPTMPPEVKLSKEDEDAVTRLRARIAANPNTAERDIATLKAIENKYTAQPRGLTYLDKPARKMEEATGEVAGKALGEEQSDLNTARESASQMIGQLDLLKKLYETPNMPEGELANGIQQVRSGLKSIGIDVGPEVDAANLASAVSGKMALLTRTADGKNLMPGAMSDFEQKILRNLVPNLESTAEGRAALIDVMKAMAQSRIRFADEANKMAEANRGILPSEWHTRKTRLMKEEMARIAQLNTQIASRFKGAK